MLEQEQIDYLNLLIDNELAVSSLYEAYAKRSESKSDFWMKLSDEEKTHAEWIVLLSEEINKKNIVLKKGKISGVEIQESIDETREELDRFLNNKLNYLTHKEQLQVALKKEKSLLERKFFTFFKTSSPELKIALKKLEKETTTHKERIEEELKKEENN